MRIFGSNTRRLIQKMFMRLRLTCSIKIPWEDFEWWWSERVRNISWQSPDPLQVSGPRSSRRCEQIFMDRWATVFWCVTVKWRRAAETLRLETRYNHQSDVGIIIYIYVKYFTSFESWILFDLPDPHLRSVCFSQLIWFKRLRLNLSLFNLELLFLSILLTN